MGFAAVGLLSAGLLDAGFVCSGLLGAGCDAVVVLSGVVSVGLPAVDSGSETLDGSGALVDGADASAELPFSTDVVLSAISLDVDGGLLLSFSVVVGV